MESSQEIDGPAFVVSYGGSLIIVGGTSKPFYGKGGCVMSINIERNLHRRSLTAIGRDLFLLGRSQSRMALFSALTCLIVIGSIAQAATPAIDLKDAVN